MKCSSKSDPKIGISRRIFDIGDQSTYSSWSDAKQKRDFNFDLYFLGFLNNDCKIKNFFINSLIFKIFCKVSEGQ